MITCYIDKIRVLENMSSSRRKLTPKRWQSLIVAFVVGCSIILGWGTSHSMEQNKITLNTKSVDKATGNYTIGEDLYLKTCATCHIPIPPAVLPSKTWETILENPGTHYGVEVKDLNRFNQRIIWQYLQNYSRLLLKDEQKPKYIAQSRYFFALHPQVEFSAPVNNTTCLECHSGAKQFDYRISHK